MKSGAETVLSMVQERRGATVTPIRPPQLSAAECVSA
jgi:hypothetical protein